MLDWWITFKVPHSRYFAQFRTMARQSVSSADYNYRGSDRSDKPHIVFQYTLSGEGYFQRLDEVYRVGPETGFICNVRDEEIGYFHSADSAEPWEFVFFSFTGQAAFDCAAGLIEKHGHILRLAGSNVLLNELLTLSSDGSRTIEMSTAENSMLAFRLFTGLEQAQKRRIVMTSSDLLVEKARSIITTGIDRNINATEVAQQLGVSREHLSRVFGQGCHVSLYKYITEQKMDRARRLLMTTSLSINEITGRLGFNSGPEFTRFFKRTRGFHLRVFARIFILRCLADFDVRHEAKVNCVRS